jgi:hypothetical protein
VNIDTGKISDVSSESDINDDPGAKMQYVEQPTDWETIGQTSIRVDQRTREDNPKKVDGSSFYLNSNYVDLANHSQVNIEDLDVDLSFTDEDLREHSIDGTQNEWKRGVLFQLKIDVTPPDQSTFTSQRYFLHTTVKAQLGTGIQFGNAFGVTEKRPDDLGSGTTESDVKSDDDLFLCDDLNFGGDDGEVSPDQ